jgi:hypothetical protein
MWQFPLCFVLFSFGLCLRSPLDGNFSKNIHSVPYHLQNSSSLSIPIPSSFTLKFEIFALPILSFTETTLISKQSFFEMKKNHSILLSLDIDLLTRVPSISTPFMNCSFNDRLSPKKLHQLVIQMDIDKEHHQLVSLLFVNGILRNKCLVSVNVTVIALFDGFGELTKVKKESQDHVIAIQEVTYWPSQLSYPQIRAFSFLPSSPQPTCNAVPDSPSSEHSPSNTIILIWPSFYSFPSLSQRSEEWKSHHLVEYLSLLIHDLSHNDSAPSPPLDKSFHHLVVPLSSSFSSSLYQTLSHAFKSLTHQNQIALTFVDTALLSPSSLSLPSYSEFINFISHQLENHLFDSNSLHSLNGFLSITSPEFCHSWGSDSAIVVLLSSHVVPKRHLVTGLVSEIVRAGDGALIGGTILNLRDEIESYGFEFHELSYAGGLDTFLVPHARYRYQFTPFPTTHHLHSLSFLLSSAEVINEQILEFSLVQQLKQSRGTSWVSQEGPGHPSLRNISSKRWLLTSKILIFVSRLQVFIKELERKEWKSWSLISHKESQLRSYSFRIPFSFPQLS